MSVKQKVLTTGKVLSVFPLTFGRGRIAIGSEMFYDDSW